MHRCCAIFVMALVFSSSAYAKVIKVEAEALREIFPGAESFEPLALTCTASDRAELKKLLKRYPEGNPQAVKALAGDGLVLGWAVIDSELGKHMPITYMVGIDPAGKIAGVELMIYREAIGGEVRSRRFRRQFEGKGPGDSLVLGKDIDAVSGATISSRTFVFGARKALWLVNKYLLKKEK